MLTAKVHRCLLRMTTSCTGCCVTSRSLCRYCDYIARWEDTFYVNDKMHVLQGFQGFGFGDGGFQMSFGIGAFPFGIFATAFNINDGRPPPGINLLHIHQYHLFYEIWNNLCLLIIFPHSGSWDTPAHGRTVSVSTLPVCRLGDYVLAADCIKAWKSRFAPMWFCLHTCFGLFFSEFFLSFFKIKMCLSKYKDLSRWTTFGCLMF